MTGSNVIADFARCVADATTLAEVKVVANTYAKDIRRMGVGDPCALILMQRRQELNS